VNSIRVSWFCSALLLAASPVLADEAPRAVADDAPLSLNAAIDRALDRNADVAVAQARLGEAKAARSRVTTQFLPNIQAVGQYTRNSVEAKFDTGGLIQSVATAISPGLIIPPGNLPPASIIQKEDTIAGALTIDETLFSLSPILARGAASHQVDAQSLNLEASRREIVYQIMQVFYNVAGMDRLIQVAQRAVALADQRIANAVNRQKQGAEGEVTVLRAQSERDKAEQDLAHVLLARDQLLMSLGALLDLPAPATLTAPPELEVPEGEMAQLEATSLHARPDLQARRQALAAGEAQVDEAQWRWMPMVTANFTGRYTDTPGFVGKNWLWSATANVVIPLFDRGLRYADADERKATTRRLQQEVTKAERDLHAGLAQTQAEIAVDRHTLEVATSQAKKAQRTAEIVARAFAAGASTSLEVAEADTNLRMAEANAERERINLNLAILRLRHLTGNVHPQ
jgi:outer membrane protein TolC